MVELLSLPFPDPLLPPLPLLLSFTLKNTPFHELIYCNNLKSNNWYKFNWWKYKIITWITVWHHIQEPSCFWSLSNSMHDLSLSDCVTANEENKIKDTISSVSADFADLFPYSVCAWSGRLWCIPGAAGRSRRPPSGQSSCSPGSARHWKQFKLKL